MASVAVTGIEMGVIALFFVYAGFKVNGKELARCHACTCNAVKSVAGDMFIFQQDNAAPARLIHSNYVTPDLWPPKQPSRLESAFGLYARVYGPTRVASITWMTADGDRILKWNCIRTLLTLLSTSGKSDCELEGRQF